jgi:hypothetical protein
MTDAQVLLIGTLLGMQHATEADHVAAVATLAARQRTLAQGMRQGAAWGVGHAVVLVAVGGIALALGQTLPPPLSRWMEMAVGVMLVLLGADTLRMRHRAEPPHVHGPWRALAVGMVHGMAGSAALVVLSLGAVQSWTLGLLYIALFGVGSIAGMALLSLAIALPLQLTAARLARLHGGLTALLGLASCTLGVVTVARYAIAG